jgi:FkbM family methyltransferase
MTIGPTDDAIEAQARLLAASGRTARHVIDAGAFRGDLTARYLERFSQAHVWAFEPTPDMARFLTQRFRNEERVTVVAAALSDSQGTGALQLNEAPATNSLLPFLPEADRYLDSPVPNKGSVDVDAVTLDAFCSAQGIEHISIVKLDVQGAALEVTKGAERLLAAGSIDLYFTELPFVPVYSGQTAPGDLLAALEKHGYRLYDLYGMRHNDTAQLKWCDALFTSPDLRHIAGI